MVKKIRKVVLPVAGLGTRLLPATKAIPKEMLPVVDRPVVQYAFDEAREAGIEEFIFVTGRNKSVIEEHFDFQAELDHILSASGSLEKAEALKQALPVPGQIYYTRQQQPLGLGHAVWCARHMIGTEPFALLLPDVLVHDSPGCTTQLLKAYQEFGGNIIAVEKTPHAELSSYGVVGGDFANARRITGGQLAFNITSMIEKPTIEQAPSQYRILGRYILQPEVIRLLSKQPPGAKGEIQLTDAMTKLLADQPFTAVEHSGISFDCGSRIGLLNANVTIALTRKDIGDPLKQLLLELVK